MSFGGKTAGWTGYHALALVLAMLLAFGAAVPGFAQEGGTTQAGSSEETGAAEGGTGDGGTVQPQIVGGEPVETGKLPFMVSIQYERRGQTNHYCGGTLIDEDSILTAAHCTDRITRVNTSTTVDYRDVVLVIGRTKLDGNQGVERRISRLSDVEEHPKFDLRLKGYRYDAAVIDFDQPVGIKPIALASRGSNNLEQPKDGAFIAGWGNTVQQGTDLSEPDRFPNRMHRAKVPIVSDRKAEKVYKSNYVSKIMVAAGRKGKDTCQGDSGGPMWAITEAGRRQIGITSFGYGCGERGFPGVYAEVNSPSIFDFIKSASSN